MSFLLSKVSGVKQKGKFYFYPNVEYFKSHDKITLPTVTPLIMIIGDFIINLCLNHGIFIERLESSKRKHITKSQVFRPSVRSMIV